MLNLRITAAILVTSVLLNCMAARGVEPDRERTLYVPFADLPLILEGPNERVFLTRQQYEQLVEEASRQPSRKAPRPAALLDADYEAEIRNQIAILRGQITLDVLDPGLHVVPLPLQGVSLHRRC